MCSPNSPQQNGKGFPESSKTDFLENTGIGSNKNLDEQFETVSLRTSDKNAKFLLYGIFNGFDGSECARFCLQHLPPELFRRLSKQKSTDEEVKEEIRKAFIGVEKRYFESLDDKTFERTIFLSGMSESSETSDPPIFAEKLKSFDRELSCGCTAVVSLIAADKLYVGNVGDCRALICKTDEDQVLRVLQLTVDHDFDNEDELLRLRNLGYQDLKIEQKEYTRCVGNFLLKTHLKEHKGLSEAIEDTIIAEPEIYAGIKLDESFRFLLLMSGGLCKSLEDIWKGGKANKELAEMVAKEFREQSSLDSIAQTVVDRISRVYEEKFGETPRRNMMLLLRNFNYPMPQTVAAASDSKFVLDANQTGLSESTEDTAEARSSYPRASSRNPSFTESSTVVSCVDFTEFYENLRNAYENGVKLDPELKQLAEEIPGISTFST